MLLKFFSIILLCITYSSCHKTKPPNEIDSSAKAELMAHIRFFASDELKGRKVGRPETKIAARYIAEQFRASGLKQFNLAPDYLQKTKFVIDGDNVKCNNVVGYLEGIKPNKRNEFVVLCAHYDHLGTMKCENSNCDSIYNGARDNAMGATALIYAAKELSKHAPERSVIFLATTAEENGMVGSRYFVENCPISTEDIVFVLNNDGGGFNTTTNIRIGGKNEILFQSNFWEVTTKYGIESLAYPAELEYLYEKGDNISFANKGIPSITISPGFNKIDKTILKYIHKPEDEASDDFDYDYLLKFSKCYCDIANEISNSEVIPDWNNGSKYSSSTNY